ncbi:PIN domain-like protein [Westerdykella ornata]|uniref:PIN domain-like protein n=1 Tax=Westerdykella ornata TaxID=318751 RepID=A0A6A6JQT0_WESOR|nr:PIN domain-like protein [Westerdykella ornata]KAF2278258.1 PIN domain-like protein [Westerdykella ornata]
MGIKDFWEVVREQDHIIPLAQLAEEHFRTHGRRLRIAVDEADWRFNNLTQAQVYTIREKSNEPVFRGIEKTMFHRICRWLTMNVQLLFVFDGPSRPWKRGKQGGNRVDYEKLKDLKEVLRHLRVPYHEAPGEAEAECARLQQLGVVDAVFSQDSDTMMFGSSLLIRDDRVAKGSASTDRSKENTKKSGKTVRIIRAEDIQCVHKFDREGLVLFAMLCGGNYDTKGLPGCGKATAIRAVKAGLGRGLCRCRTQQECRLWSLELGTFLRREIPSDFPKIKTLEKYLRPNISSDERLRNLRCLEKGWDQPINELELLKITGMNFNIWGKSYMNKVEPILLTRSLVLAAAESSAVQGNPHAIRLVKQRAKKDVTQTPLLERKLTFSPFALTSLRRSDFEGERLGYWDGAKDIPFDPEHRVECEIPYYLLEQGLSADVLNPPTPSPKKTTGKRKRQVDVREDGRGCLSPSKASLHVRPYSATPTSGTTCQLLTHGNGRGRDAALCTPSKPSRSTNLRIPPLTTNSVPRPSYYPTTSLSTSSSSVLQATDDSDCDIFEELDFLLGLPSTSRASRQTGSRQWAPSATVDPTNSDGFRELVSATKRRRIDDGSVLNVTPGGVANAGTHATQRNTLVDSSPASCSRKTQDSRGCETGSYTKSPVTRHCTKKWYAFQASDSRWQAVQRCSFC